MYQFYNSNQFFNVKYLVVCDTFAHNVKNVQVRLLLSIKLLMFKTSLERLHFDGQYSSEWIFKTQTLIYSSINIHSGVFIMYKLSKFKQMLWTGSHSKVKLFIHRKKNQILDKIFFWRKEATSLLNSSAYRKWILCLPSLNSKNLDWRAECQ